MAEQDREIQVIYAVHQNLQKGTHISILMIKNEKDEKHDCVAEYLAHSLLNGHAFRN